MKSSRWLLHSFFALSTILLVPPGVARADTVLFSDLVGTPAYSSNGLAVSGAGSLFGFQEVAYAFTPSLSYTLTYIDIALTHFSGDDSATVTLNSDSAGEPGAVLETWSLSGLSPYNACCTVQTLTSGSDITFLSGQRYWIVASPASNLTADIWNEETASVFGLQAVNFGSSWTTHNGVLMGGFDVFGVPEPTTMALVLGGAGFLGVCRRRRR